MGVEGEGDGDVRCGEKRKGGDRWACVGVWGRGDGKGVEAVKGVCVCACVCVCVREREREREREIERRDRMGVVGGIPTCPAPALPVSISPH